MKYLISLLFAAFAAMASAVSPGITVSVSAAGVNYVMAQVWTSGSLYTFGLFLPSHVLLPLFPLLSLS